MKLHDRLGLKESELEFIINTLSSFKNIYKAIIYGSRAKGNFKAFSDIDLTLLGNDLSQKDIFRLAEAFDESSLPYLFDISNFNELKNPELIDHINRRGINIFER